VADAVTRLQKDGAKGVVLDMRGNPGGILEQSIQMSNLFLKNGQEIVSVRGRGAAPQSYGTSGNASFPTIPLTVLTDEGSASASEIVAGALQDHDRALVVGSTSFGKGLVQTLFPLDGGYALKITTAKWYTPSGRSIQRERKFENGRFVEEKPDSAETEAKKKARPAYKSDAGRIVYGGGGIEPDKRVAGLEAAMVELQAEVARLRADLHLVKAALASAAAMYEQLANGSNMSLSTALAAAAAMYRTLTDDDAREDAGA